MNAPVLRLTWWEAEELLEHFRSRTDIWMQSDENENLWLRVDPQDQLCCGVLILVPADLTSPFRMFQLKALPFAWDESMASTYIRQTVAAWTTWKRREDVAEFLRDQLSIERATADLAAIGIVALEWEETKKAPPDAPPVQTNLWTSTPPPIFDQDPSDVGTWLLQGNIGWLRLRLTGGMLRTTLMLKAKNARQHLQFEGFVRPKIATAREAAAALAGWPAVEDGEAIEAQETLPKDVDA